MHRPIRAHFDGKVFVPDQPVDLPVNAVVELACPSFDRAHEAAGEVPTAPGPDASAAEFVAWLESLPSEGFDELPRDLSTHHDRYLDEAVGP